mmetsp:Transcript_26419/g.36494  ORF Transcript_26419/g.36494 Transcript_26419/m.36494 type:complete len:463 (-) Transcript_26419:166-1554(-)|eukprot:CAMPEP_0196586690 /NCGR_PEP_ID=MMETSP1081-20130531/55222_1 /TAXON_ID=36882 /ORGANISM="Pyramimonas amylifera, Strain CCMP720" /LENGTH=462 /DNA_ID=CAMNT_0041908653 /DNA_START=427 /DNA_END=1815 /DNA_ORIENTATION=+
MAEERAIAVKDEGNQHFKEGRYQPAIGLYSKAISIAPHLSSLYGNRSAAWFMVGQASSQPQAFNECIRDCEKAIEIDPQFVKAYLRFARALVHLGKIDRAESLLQEGEKTVSEENAPQLRTEREEVGTIRSSLASGDTHLAAGEFKKALASYSPLQSRCLTHSALILGMASAHIGLDNPAQALRLTLTVISSDTQNAEAYYIRGEALYLTMNLDQGKKHFQEALRLNPDHSKSIAAFKRIRNIERFIESGKAAAEKRDYEEAVTQFSSAMSLDSSNHPLVALVAVERGNAYMRLKQFQQALEDCDLAIEHNNKITAPLITRCMAHQALGQHEEAVADLEAALELDSESIIIKDRLKRAKVELRKSKRIDYYAMLGLTEMATDSEIKIAYKKKALEWHPDKNNSSPEASEKAGEMFRQIGEAQEILTNPRKKALYDEGHDKEMIEKQMQMDESHSHMFGGGCC